MNYWLWLVISAFVSVIGFFNINSAWADKYKWNKKLLWVSIAVGLFAVFCLYKVYSLYGGSQD